MFNILQLIYFKNIAIDIYLELDGFENMSVSVACRLGLVLFVAFFL